MNHDQDKLTDHEYDGIQEYDNPLPNWWLITFFGTIIFAFVYWVHYEFGGGPSLKTELSQAMEQIEKNKASAPTQIFSEEQLAALEQDPEQMKLAAGNFAEKCAACHGNEMQGLVGPNLTDDYWIHGQGKRLQIMEVVRKGVPEKGMLAWQNILPDDEIARLTAFVHSKRGSQPAQPKAPEGQKVN